MISNCTRCRKAIRIFPLVREADAPGTIRGYKTGLCVTCTREDLAKASVKISTILPKCHRCHRPMRPYKERKEGWPNTVARVTPSKCQSCWEKERRGLPKHERDARLLKVPELTDAEKRAAARLVARYGGDKVVLAALGLSEVFAEVG